MEESDLDPQVIRILSRSRKDYLEKSPTTPVDERRGSKWEHATKTLVPKSAHVKIDLAED